MERSVLLRGNWFASAATFRKGLPEKLAFFALNQIDLALTVLAVSLGLSELNPFMKYMLEAPLLLVLVKQVIPLLIAWLMPGRLLVPAVVLLLAVVGWNVKELALFLL